MELTQGTPPTVADCLAEIDSLTQAERLQLLSWLKHRYPARFGVRNHAAHAATPYRWRGIPGTKEGFPMNDGLASTLADIDCCAVDLERVKNAVFIFLEIVHQDIEVLRKLDNALLQSCNKRLTESLAIIELSGIVLGTTVDLLTDIVNRLYHSQGAQPNSTTADN